MDSSRKRKMIRVFLCVRYAQKSYQRRKRKGTIERARRKKEGEEKKNRGCTISFYIGYFGNSFLTENKCLKKEVYLAVTCSVIQPEI